MKKLFTKLLLLLFYPIVLIPISICALRAYFDSILELTSEYLSDEWWKK